jgi:hypothetical protein
MLRCCQWDCGSVRHVDNVIFWGLYCVVSDMVTGLMFEEGIVCCYVSVFWCFDILMFWRLGLGDIVQ